MLWKILFPGSDIGFQNAERARGMAGVAISVGWPTAHFQRLCSPQVWKHCLMLLIFGEKAGLANGMIFSRFQ